MFTVLAFYFYINTDTNIDSPSFVSLSSIHAPTGISITTAKRKFMKKNKNNNWHMDQLASVDVVKSV